jgi:hypothetical protein
LGLGDLHALKHQCQLDDLDDKQFAERLKFHCTQILHDHPSLTIWIERRSSLLEYVLHPPSTTPSYATQQVAQGLRHGITTAFSYMAAGVREAPLLERAEEIADDVGFQALDAAAVEASAILGGGRSNAKANLMVPVRMRTPFLADVPPPLQETAGARHATEIWSKCNIAEECMVVAAQTEGAGHMGFWVPLIKGEGGANLPGAAAAYFLKQGDAVFRDDLPYLVGFPEAANSTWLDYMNKHFPEDLFVSLRFLVPTRPGTHSGSGVAAVLNVNVQPSDKSVWRRAYHREWLESASAAVAPFIEVAFNALLVKIEIDWHRGRNVLALQTGSRSWDTLPGMRVLRAIEEKRNATTK